MIRAVASNDELIRASALSVVGGLSARWGDAVPFDEIERGFEFQGERVLLLSRAEGVFKPAQLSDGALSIRSALRSRYSDEPLSERKTTYDYSPHASRNEWLRSAMQQRLNLIYFIQVKAKPGPEYLIIAPVRIIGDEPAKQRFTVDLAPDAPLYDPGLVRTVQSPARLYDNALVKVRLFQAHFRRTVLAAYGQRCCVCSLPERPLLDGAHIIADREVSGEPIVNNGLALCALHHRAFDTELMSVAPDYKVVVIDEHLSHPDDPANKVLLDHRGQRIRLPKDEALWPDRERLEKRQAELTI